MVVNQESVQEKILQGKVLNSWNGRLTITGNQAKLTVKSYRTRIGNIIFLGNGEYLDTKTGKYFHSKRRSQNKLENIASLKKSFRRLEEKVACNFFGESNEMFITLTYRKNMQDYDKVGIDWKNFYNKQFKNFKIKHGLGDSQFVCVKEIQARGAIHLHVLLKFPEIEKVDKNNFPYREFNKLWVHGRTDIEHINPQENQHITNIARYFTAYFRNLELNDLEALMLDPKFVATDAQKKKYEKYGRLKLFPSNKKIFSTSRNLKEPEIIDATVEEHKKSLEALGMHYQGTKSYEFDNNGVRGSVTNQTFSK